MTKQIEQVTRHRKMNTLRFLLVSGIAAAMPVFAAGGSGVQDSDSMHSGHDHAAPAKLVEMVRHATRHYIDVNAATNADYHPFLGCISGPDHGAMGVHYVNGGLVGDGEIDASRPEALIYEPEAKSTPPGRCRVYSRCCDLARKP